MIGSILVAREPSNLLFPYPRGRALVCVYMYVEHDCRVLCAEYKLSAVYVLHTHTHTHTVAFHIAAGTRLGGVRDG